jgi:glutathione S-transferase
MREDAMAGLTLSDPLLATYAVAAGLMILKTLAMAWLTVWRMMQEKGGYRAPEDLRRTPLNPNPDPAQLDPNERVERARRIHQNDLENVPFFLAAGFLWVLTGPPLWLAQVALFGYVATRILHFWAYATARSHDLRATFWTAGVLIVIAMTLHVVVAALAAL